MKKNIALMAVLSLALLTFTGCDGTQPPKGEMAPPPEQIEQFQGRQAFFAKVEEYEKKQQWDNLIKETNKAIEAEPNEYIYYQKKASALTALGKFEEALENMTKAMAMEGSHQDYGNYSLRGEIYHILGKDDLAKADFEKAKEIIVKNNDSRAQKVLENINKQLAELGK